MTSHYWVFGQAILDALELALGGEFGREARNAWSSAYRLIARTMIAAASDEEQKLMAVRKARQTRPDRPRL
jgi:hemoglobin-like flavoprotein